MASQNAEATVAKCLASLERQNRDGLVEVIVVDNSRDATARIVENAFTYVQLIKISEPLLIPQLWAEGAKRASGKVIAFTTAHFVPDDHWVQETVGHHLSEYAAIGGVIENAQPASLTQWGVYFCRYASYMLPFSPHLVQQVPGDNASYKQWVLEKYAHLIKEGFWETIVNDQLTKDGYTLLMTPSIRVDQGGSWGVWAFCKQRLTHGRIFGAERVAKASPARRLLFIGASPLVPFIFLMKISGEVFRKKRHRRAFLASLSVLALFILSWSLGESVGYLLGYAAQRNRLYG